MSKLVLACVGLCTVMLGCRGDQQLARPAGGELSGIVKIDGSSTVFPITEAVAEEFQKEHRDVKVTVGISGTGGGFQKFGNGEIDIADASRPIKSPEVELAVKNQVEYIELPVAYDGLAVVVNPKNSWCSQMTVRQLKKLWEPEAQGKVTRWNQVRSEWPNREIHLFGAGVDSGTYDYFTQAVVGKEHSSRGDFTSSEDDNVLVQGVANDEGALGFFGLAYYEQNRDKLKLVGIDDEDSANGAGPIQPSRETVANGTYQPLARPIFIYVSKKGAERAEVRSFVEFYLAHAGTLVQEVGYIPLGERIYQLAAERFRNRVTGSIFGGQGSQVGISLDDLLQREVRPSGR